MRPVRTFVGRSIVRRSTLWVSGLFLSLVSVLLLSGCAYPAALPTPALEATSTLEAQAAPTETRPRSEEPIGTQIALDTPISLTTPATGEIIGTAVAPMATAETLPEPTPDVTPTPILPSPEQARDRALDFLREAYQLRLPANDSFTAVENASAVEGFQWIATYTSGPVTVAVGAPQNVEDRYVVPVKIDNDQANAHWWGEVDSSDLVATTVAAGLPRPRSRDVSAWIGHVVKLPAGSPYDDDFEGAQGNRHGIDSNVGNVLTILDSLNGYIGRVKIWGELRYGVDDYNGRRILVRKIELLDGPLSEDTGQSGATAEPEPIPTTTASVESLSSNTDFGPSGAILSPLPHGVIASPVQVMGEAEGAFENQCSAAGGRQR